jgi:hypothetical protein
MELSWPRDIDESRLDETPAAHRRDIGLAAYVMSDRSHTARGFVSRASPAWFGGWLWGIAGVALAVPLLVSIKALTIELGSRTATEPGESSLLESTAESPARAPAAAADPL